MKKRPKKRDSEQPKLRAWRPTVEDARLLSELRDHMGIQSASDIVRHALRALAREQGLVVAR